MERFVILIFTIPLIWTQFNYQDVDAYARKGSSMDMEIFALYPIKDNNINNSLDNALDKSVFINRARTIRSATADNKLNEIKSILLELKKDFGKIHDRTPNFNCDEAKMYYESDIAELETNINNSRNSIQKSRFILDVVITKYLKLQNKYNDALANMNDLYRQLKEISVRLCASEINKNKIYAALAEFTRLNDNSQISKIINYGYDNNIANARNILKFIHNLSDEKYIGWVVGYKSLFTEIEINKALHKQVGFVIACAIKDIMDGKHKPYHDIPAEARKEFENLKERLPKLIRTIVWDNVCIKNNGEYLYPAFDGVKYDQNRRRVFSWAENIPKFAEGYWKFECGNESTTYFKINSVHYGEYFYAPVFFSDKGKREVFTWKPETNLDNCTNEQCLWEIIVNDDETVKLRNVKLNEYLHTAPEFYSDKRRRVRTSNNANVRQLTWEITSC